MTPASPAAGLATRADLDPGSLTYDDRGLVAVVAQDVATGAVLMLAWADREAVERTLESGQAWFWSRSRQELWRKGATSGNTLDVLDVLADCDRDSLLYRVRPAGPACHTGKRTCFERPGAGSEVGELELGWLYQVLEQRRAAGDPESSYTARLLAKGRPRIAQKVAEEAAETVIASLVRASSPAAGANGEDAADGELIGEAADLLYHLLVLLLDCGVPPRRVAERLLHRHAGAPAPAPSETSPVTAEGGA
ncbi:MAG: bifunctional phosphoribosyl-AMP cyclohydrolase/phosphoribosyl-ATP diphosphatase HisIE [Holophagales bacterium]|nr:bifunctional phosphoribosyl-AMP cyclohydrolase/phosphoribosyl-ATP diphosphatase HisIE [Holophagales bacterium]